MVLTLTLRCSAMKRGGVSAAESGLCKERAHGSRGAHGRYDLGGRNHRLLDISAAERLNQSDVGRLPSCLQACLVRKRIPIWDR